MFITCTFEIKHFFLVNNMKIRTFSVVKKSRKVKTIKKKIFSKHSFFISKSNSIYLLVYSRIYAKNYQTK